jgi:uncharacterized protein YrrD
MLMFNQKIISQSVASIQASHKIGQVVDFLIDPRNLSIPVLYVESQLNPEPLVLYTSDIANTSMHGILIDHNDLLMETEGLVRLQKLIDIGFELINKSVVTEDGSKLGRIASFVFDSNTWLILKLHVKQSLVKNINSSELIIHRQQIVKVSDKEITVKSTAIRSKKTKFSWKKILLDTTKPVLESDSKT